jgi:hypothetical protein
MSLVLSQTNTEIIRDLNDRARTTFTGCVVMMTATLAHSCEEVRSEVLRRVREFRHFNEDNDPWSEHDFGSFKIAGQSFNFRIDCYDREMEHGSPNAANPDITTRVITIGPAADF